VSEFMYEEKRLASALGVTRPMVKAVRVGLSFGEQWTKKSGRIVLTRKGVVLISTQLLARCPTDDEMGLICSACKIIAPEKEASLGLPEGVPMALMVIDRPRGAVVMVVDLQTRHNRNIQIVMARPSRAIPRACIDEKGMVRVRVRNNEKFTHGMEMQCRHLQKDLWELIGRCPRYRGRW